VKFLNVTISDENGVILGEYKLVDESTLTNDQIEDLDFMDDNNFSEIEEIESDIKLYQNQIKKGL